MSPSSLVAYRAGGKWIIATISKVLPTPFLSRVSLYAMFRMLIWLHYIIILELETINRVMFRFRPDESLGHPDQVRLVNRVLEKRFTDWQSEGTAAVLGRQGMNVVFQAS